MIIITEELMTCNVLMARICSRMVCLCDLAPEVARAITHVPRADVSDVLDRIIPATALHVGLPLIGRASPMISGALPRP